MSRNSPTHAWKGKAMTPIHDRLYGRPSSAYGEPGSEPCPEHPPAPCVEVMAGRLGPLGAGLAAGTALAGVGLALKASFAEAAAAEQSSRRLDAVLKATGYAAGLTAGEISRFADGIEASTLAAAEGVQDAAAILATFRSVSGETFTRALTLAQDMAAVFGQDLSSAATQLGKALEDPIDGLTALRRVGVSFSDSQKELIQTLVETGQTAEAQRVILDALAQQVGGAGVAEAGGLTGATNRLQDAWGNLLEALGRTPAITGIAQGALNLLAGAIEGLSAAFADDPIGDKVDAAKAKLAHARDELVRIEAGAPGTPMLGQRFALDEQRQRVTALEHELDALARIGEAETKAAETEKTCRGRRPATAGRACHDPHGVTRQVALPRLRRQHNCDTCPCLGQSPSRPAPYGRATRRLQCQTAYQRITTARAGATKFSKNSVGAGFAASCACYLGQKTRQPYVVLIK